MTIWQSGDIWDEVYREGISIKDKKVITRKGEVMTETRTW
jgi:hypothetical protein